MSAGFCLCMLAFSLWCYPETRGLSLEQVQDELRAHWLWRRWAPAPRGEDAGSGEDAKP